VAAHLELGHGRIHLKWDLDFALKASIDWAEPGFCTKKKFVMAEEGGFKRPLSDYTIPVNDLLE
jgi:hypothetical protein